MKHLSNRVRGRQILNTVGSAGTALLMTILILNSIILISLAAAKLIFSGVTESNTQARSTKAYFAAEAGAERILYEYRQTHKCGKPFSALGSCRRAALMTSIGKAAMIIVMILSLSFPSAIIPRWAAASNWISIIDRQF